MRSLAAPWRDASGGAGAPHHARDDLSDVQQDLIAARVAVGVVERLEMIQVEVAGDEAAAARYPLGEMSVDLAVAGQARERIRMSGCLDLLRGDLPQQIDGS